MVRTVVSRGDFMWDVETFVRLGYVGLLVHDSGTDAPRKTGAPRWEHSPSHPRVSLPTFGPL